MLQIGVLLQELVQHFESSILTITTIIITSIISTTLATIIIRVAGNLKALRSGEPVFSGLLLEELCTSSACSQAHCLGAVLAVATRALNPL